MIDIIDDTDNIDPSLGVYSVTCVRDSQSQVKTTGSVDHKFTTGNTYL